MLTSNLAKCHCGEVAIELLGKPIQSVICYCESCRTAGRVFDNQSGAPTTVNSDGGVDYCLYRKDRVCILHGAHHLTEHRLKPQSPTRRVAASCCGSAIFLDFAPGHWLTVFRNSLTGPSPQPQMRIMTQDRPQGEPISKAIPAFNRQPPSLMFKLLLAWVKMGFKTAENHMVTSHSDVNPRRVRP